MLGVALLVYFAGPHHGLGPVVFAGALILAGIVLIIRTLRVGSHVFENNQIT